MIEKTTEINMLYDFYQALLTDKQKEYMEMYYHEDYSLGEIAEMSKVSRQAIYDTIRRTEQLLLSYEDKLSLYEKFTQHQQLLKELEEALTEKSKSTDDKILSLLEALRKID